MPPRDLISFPLAPRSFLPMLLIVLPQTAANVGSHNHSFARTFLRVKNGGLNLRRSRVVLGSLSLFSSAISTWMFADEKEAG